MDIHQKAKYIPRCHHLKKVVEIGDKAVNLEYFFPPIFLSFLNEFKEFETDDVTILTTAAGVTLPTYTLKKIAFSPRSRLNQKIELLHLVEQIEVDFKVAVWGRSLPFGKTEHIENQPYLVTGISDLTLGGSYCCDKRQKGSNRGQRIDLYLQNGASCFDRVLKYEN